MLSTHLSKFVLGSQPDLRFLFDLNGNTGGQGAPTSSMRRDGEHAQPRDGRRRSATTPERPPAISVVPPAPRRSRPTETRTPPGSPMDVDYEPPSSPPKPRRPVISVFDWDDTVCPSSWLHREGLLAAYKLVDGPVEPQDSSFGGQASESSPHEMSPGHRLALHQFEEHVIALLQYARQFGPVFIVTAAKLQWVRSCAEYFLPRVLQTLIKSETVHVISAREFYLGRKQRSAAPLGPGDEGTPLAWKATTFNAICTHLRVDEVAQRRAQSSPSRSSRVNFISVGDSFSERDACRMLELSAPSVMRSKTVKYLEQPHVLELMDQVRMTRVIYEQICRHAGGLDLHMVRSRGSIQVLQVDTPGQAPSTARSNPSPRRHSVATGGPIGARTPL